MSHVCECGSFTPHTTPPPPLGRPPFHSEPPPPSGSSNETLTHDTKSPGDTGAPDKCQLLWLLQRRWHCRHLSHAEAVWIKASIKRFMLRLSGEAQLVHLRGKELWDVASRVSHPSCCCVSVGPCVFYMTFSTISLMQPISAAFPFIGKNIKLLNGTTQVQLSTQEISAVIKVQAVLQCKVCAPNTHYPLCEEELCRSEDTFTLNSMNRRHFSWCPCSDVDSVCPPVASLNTRTFTGKGRDRGTSICGIVFICSWLFVFWFGETGGQEELQGQSEDGAVFTEQ